MSLNLQLFSEADCQWLHDHPWLAGAEIYREIDSTNRRALQCAATIASPHLVLAETQTAGRGRGVNQWFSGEGGLMFSLRLDTATVGLPRSELGILSLAAGLAVREALTEFVPAASLQLKWPNDVYLDGRKVCGILLEVAGGASPVVVVGVGVNVHNRFTDAPPDVQRRATSLADQMEHPPSLRDVLEPLLESFERETHHAATGTLNLVSRWQPCCFLHNKFVEIRQVAEVISGRCQGICESGALLVQTESGTRKISSGEVATIR